jgi:hypothetical protein
MVLGSDVCDACARVVDGRPSAPVPDLIAALAGKVQWHPLPGWEHQEDVDIARRAGLIALASLAGGVLMVVTDGSLSKTAGGCVVEAVALEAFIADHLRRFGECFCNGDVVIVQAAGAFIWLFHHEGLYTSISPRD